MKKDVIFCQTCRTHVLALDGKTEVKRYLFKGAYRTMTRFICNKCQSRRKPAAA